nr:unnamed protein product [Digitaria exilis]
MDYLKTVVPSQLMAERGSNLVVINPGSANVRMGFASQDVPFNIPHCIARRIHPQEGEEPKFFVRDQMLNCHVTSSQNAERESAYDIIAALMKIPFLDEDMPSPNQPLPPKEALAAAFGNGLSTACVVNIGAQVTQVVCVEDGVALPHTALALPYGGDDISRCLLWVQRRHRTWPNFQTDPVSKPIDMLMLNKIKESYSQIKVPPMGLLYPRVLVPEEYPPPPRSWFQDYDDMLEDTWQTSDNLYSSGNGGFGMWDSYPMLPTRLKKFDNIGLVEAIVSSVLSTGRVDLQRKLFCSIQLVGGAASTAGLAPVLEQRSVKCLFQGRL